MQADRGPEGDDEEALPRLNKSRANVASCPVATDALDGVIEPPEVQPAANPPPTLFHWPRRAHTPEVDEAVHAAIPLKFLLTPP